MISGRKIPETEVAGGRCLTNTGKTADIGEEESGAKEKIYC